MTLVHSSGATAGLPRDSMDEAVGTVSPVTISTVQPNPFSRMAAWMCASTAADGHVISAMSIVRSVSQEISCARAGCENHAATARTGPTSKPFLTDIILRGLRCC